MKILLMIICCGLHVTRHCFASTLNNENYAVSIKEQKINKFKPVFRNCSTYHPKVDEESKKDTFVIKVEAFDGDNDNITYSMVSSDNKFRIDPITGELRTNAIFNRDEPSRQKVVYANVKATDHGRPQLEDICTLKIVVNDVNDNYPVFDRAEYGINVPLDTKVGTMLLRVSATDVDHGPNQVISYNLESQMNPAEVEYFKWDDTNGEIRLNRRIDKPVSHIFLLNVTASDGGNPSKSTRISINIVVKESKYQSPTITLGDREFNLSETYHNYSKPVATYTVNSNIDDDDSIYAELVRGRTDQTNQGVIFRAIHNAARSDLIDIFLAHQLDYEKVPEYTLTLLVRNSQGLAAETRIHVVVIDENNRAPFFTNIEAGSVLENQPSGSLVMKVNAVDNDKGDTLNSLVKYNLTNCQRNDMCDKFMIDEYTGVITTKQTFDREKKAHYTLEVTASDSAPSSLHTDGRPNRTPQNFRILIADMNDNPPYFPKQNYEAVVPEDQDEGSKVIEVRAKDLDTDASLTTYSIVNGNPNGSFKIEDKTGIITVGKALDYEQIKSYNLLVRAWDGTYHNDTNVHINIENMNDMKPIFKEKAYTLELEEESIKPYPILRVTAIDPDIEDITADQNIYYRIDSKSLIANYFHIDAKTGDITIIKPLDRDPPFGYPIWEGHIFAKDENGGKGGLENHVRFSIALMDINDNAPYLNMPNGLLWYENEPPGDIGELLAEDNDNVENGRPFSFSIDEASATETIKRSFVVNKASKSLRALVTFDREFTKQYHVPIKVCDVKDLCAVSILLVTIGDVNDNPMKTGNSDIFVYNYEGNAPDTEIGRVYVNDPDDWDLPDKKFRFKKPFKWMTDFSVNLNTGMITMKHGVKLEDTTTFFYIEFLVEDYVHGQTGTNAVLATVNVTVQIIPREAVVKSGSIRITGAAEDFIKTDPNGVSRRDRFQRSMSRFLNATYVDVFTLIPVYSGGGNGVLSSMTDVRFSAHGSPYMKALKMERILAQNKYAIMSEIDIVIQFIHIDACSMSAYSNICGGDTIDSNCVNDLVIYEDKPIAIFTNTSTLVGINASTRGVCACTASDPWSIRPCSTNPCLNGGTCLPDLKGSGYRCTCSLLNDEYYGPNCEQLAASYNGQGWSLHADLPVCGNSHLTMVFNTFMASGTLFYAGPSLSNYIENMTDFVSLEVNNGRLVMMINFGDGTNVLKLPRKVNDGKQHYVVLRWTNDTIQMELDDKQCSNELSSSYKSSECFVEKFHHGKRKYLNTRGGFHVGGLSFGQTEFKSLADAFKLNRNQLPQGDGFAGCVRNLTFSASGEVRLFDLGNPSDAVNHQEGCNAEFVQAITSVGLNLNFFIVIVVCVVVIISAVIILAFYRRKKHIYGDKDMDCDIRETIINYDDEGGGEGDQTAYDLSVLRLKSNGDVSTMIAPHKFALPSYSNGDEVWKSTHPPPDIQTFLQSNKERIDGDSETNPYDDLRHYAYEGDGNSGGSLSSLNSTGSSDPDLQFNYLHNFGPRFKKLADMYGDDSSSDEDSNVPPPSESWC